MIRKLDSTGDNALGWVQEQNAVLQRLAGMLRTSVADLPERVVQVQDQTKTLEKELEQARAKLAASAGNDLAAKAIDVKGVQLLAATVSGVEPKALRGMVDGLKDKLKSAVVLLGAAGADGKISLVGGVTADLTGKVKAGDLVGFVAAQVGGKGGGRPDMAMGGGSDVASLPAAVASVQAWLSEKL